MKSEKKSFKRSALFYIMLTGLVFLNISTVLAAGNPHWEDGLVNNASDATASNGSIARVYNTARTNEVVEGVVGSLVSNWWDMEVGVNLPTPWAVGDDHICIIDKERTITVPIPEKEPVIALEAAKGSITYKKGYYAVINKNLTSAGVDMFNACTLRPIPIPAAVAAGRNINLTWTAAVTDEGTPARNNIAGYNIYRSTSINSGFEKINSSVLVSTSYTDTSAPQGVSLYYAIQLVYRATAGTPLTSLYNSAPSNAVMSSDVMPPAAPTNLTVNDMGTGNSLDLAWTAPTTNQDGTVLSDLDGYNVYRSLVSGETGTKVNLALVTTESYKDTGLTLGTTYYYMVKAVDDSANANESAASNQASGRPTLYTMLDMFEYNEGIIYYTVTTPGVVISSVQDMTDKVQGISSTKLAYSYPTGTQDPAVVWGGLVGGILPASTNISGFNGVSFWLKGDGSDNTVRLDLQESPVAGVPTNETWSGPEISLKNTAWHKVEAPLSLFTRNIYGTNIDGVFSKNVIQYQLVYTSKSNTSGIYQHIDKLIAEDVDITPPVITHTPVTSPKKEGTVVPVLATVTDDTAVATKEIRYRAINTSDPYSVSFMGSGGGLIPAAAVKVPGIQYYIQAWDTNGNTTIHGPHTFTVTDQTKPTITAVNPLNNATNVALRPAVSATFSEKMDQASVNAAFQISPKAAGELAWTSNTITFTPSVGLEQNTAYTVTIANTAKDLADNTMLSNYSWTFTTGTGAGDTTKPTVIAVAPVNGSVDISVNGNISVTFSEAMRTPTSEYAVWVSDVNMATCARTWNGNTVTFTPATPLNANKTYYAGVSTMESNARDLSGNTLAAEYNWSFTTGTSTTDTTGPTVISSTPYGYGVPINSKISATFNEPIDPSTVTSSTFVTNPRVSGTFTVTGSKVELVPSSPMALNTSYSVNILAVVKDTAGNAMQKPYSWTFTTGDYVGIDNYEGTENISYYDGGDIKSTDHGYDLVIKHDGVQGERVKYSYTGATWGGYWGGVLPVNLDISATNGVMFWLKGDGSNNKLKLELKESGANYDIWSGPEIALSGTDWKKIEIPYGSFTRNASQSAAGSNAVFDKNIVGYTFIYTGTNASAVNNYIDTLNAGQISDVTPPSSVEGTAMTKSGNDLTLAWTAATDNSVVDHYNVYRSTTATFVPAPANLIGSSTTTSFTDAGGLTANESYYYKVKAVDGTNNESVQPSNVGYKFYLGMTYSDISNINWISLPAVSPYKKAADLALDIPNASIIARFNPATQTYQQYIKHPAAGWTGDNFDVVPGEAYEVIISASTAAKLVGWHKPYTINLNLTDISQIHWLSLPYNSAYLKASNVVPAVSGAAIIARFNTATQEYVQYIKHPAAGWIGTDFDIIPGEGLEIIIDANTSFSPQVNE